jgi:putative transposase
MWRRVNPEGQVLDAFVTKRLDRKAALKLLRKLLKRYDRPVWIVTDLLRSYDAALNEIVTADRQLTGRWTNNQAKNSHLPFRRGERAVRRIRRMRHLQQFAAVHASLSGQFNRDRSLSSRSVFKLNRAAAMAKWRGLCAA